MLRNAFESVATERTLQRVLNALGFARDPQDRMRAVVENTVNVQTAATNTMRVNAVYGDSNSGSPYVTWYNTVGFPWTMDPREQHKLAMRATMQEVRLNRWTFT